MTATPPIMKLEMSCDRVDVSPQDVSFSLSIFAFVCPQHYAVISAGLGFPLPWLPLLRSCLLVHRLLSSAPPCSSLVSSLLMRPGGGQVSRGGEWRGDCGRGGGGGGSGRPGRGHQFAIGDHGCLSAIADVDLPKGRNLREGRSTALYSPGGHRSRDLWGGGQMTNDEWRMTNQ